ncbi:hypothetical protein [Halosegnis sp.]|uniref:hypothetical protein n=1 Tax=Halosegnis sp. TaxID=2864959 RepID=UPI0035D4298B
MTLGASRERVTARLAQLRGIYDGFDVRQTTLSVDPAEFDRVCGDGNSPVFAEVSVTDGGGRHLLVDTDEGWRRPWATVGIDESIDETVRERVAERTGVTVEIQRLETAAIVSVDCEPTDASTYQLQLQFVGTPAGGRPIEKAAWRAQPPASDAVR